VSLACLVLAGTVLAQQRPPAPGQAVPSAFRPPPQPLFTVPDIRRDLNITNDQLNRLNEAYGRLRQGYQDEFSRLGNLNEQQRAQRIQELNRTFNTDIGRMTGGILTPDQLNRYGQLQLQQRGLEAFSDADIRQRLNLTDQQIQGLRQMEQDYDRLIRELRRDVPANRNEALRRYDQFQQQTRDRLNNLFTEQQRNTWGQMIGNPFNFRPDFGTDPIPGNPRNPPGTPSNPPANPSNPVPPPNNPVPRPG
jgi:hypothetical protein